MPMWCSAPFSAGDLAVGVELFVVDPEVAVDRRDAAGGGGRAV
jgi:hypothetical protein